jgi:hypothetical protein
MLNRMSQHCKSIVLVVSFIVLSATVSFSQIIIPEAYLGDWSTNCLHQSKANMAEAQKPPAFVMSSCSKGTGVYYARTYGKIYHVEDIQGGIVVFYHDEMEGNQALILELSEGILHIDRDWSHGFMRCSLPMVNDCRYLD